MRSKENKNTAVSTMFDELAARNVKKSAKNYQIYFFTLMLSVCLFYSFNSVSTQFASLGLEDKLNYLSFSSSVLTAFSVVVCIIMGTLVVYANRFLLKRRKKEMGIYATLGMEREDLNRLLMKETLRIGVVSLIAGLVLGIFAAQILSLITAKLAGLSLTSYHFMISIKAIILSVIFFGILFFFVHRFNVKELKKMSLLDMLYADRKNETVSETNRSTDIPAAILAVVLMLCGYAVIFFMAEGNVFKALGIGGAMLIVGTVLFFSSAYSVMARLMKRNKSTYFQGLNMFTASQFTSRVKTEGYTGAMITVLLFLSLSLTVLGPGMGKYVMNGIENANPYDGTIFYAYAEGELDNPLEELRKAGFEIDEFTDEYVSFLVYGTPSLTGDFLTKGQTVDSDAESNPFAVIGVEDYNRMLALQNKKPISLGADEYAVSYAFPPVEKEMKAFARKPQKLKLDGKELKLAENGVYRHAWENTNVLTDQGTIIVPQIQAESLTPMGWILDFNLAGDVKSERERLDNKWNERNTEGFRLMTGQDAIISITADNLLTTYLGIYLGITFLITAGAVLALQQLTQSTDNVKRYDLLRKLGASKNDMRHSFVRQLGVHFGLPMIVAATHALIVIILVFRYFEGLSFLSMAAIAGFGIILVLAVYAVYILTTYEGSKRILEL